jgi:dihydroorotate dehydrogenase (NAD+) catalytic subunit
MMRSNAYARLAGGVREQPMNLSTRLGRLILKNPILVASGTFGNAHEFQGIFDLSCLGAIIPKTVTREPRPGNTPPRTVETPSGLLNSIGLDNDGIEHFLRHHLPRLRAIQTAIIVNIAGRTYEDFVELADLVGQQSGIAALELNISCPNVSGGVDFGTNPESTARVVRGVRNACPLPILAKLTPNVTDIIPIAQAAADGGADALSLVNTFLGVAVNWRKRQAILGGVTGGLSGPAIKPLALRIVWQVAQSVPIPIVGIGGIANIDDVLDYVVCGAAAVQIGTANFFDPTVAARLIDELPAACQSAGADSITDLIGAIHTRGTEEVTHGSRNRGSFCTACSRQEFH